MAFYAIIIFYKDINDNIFKIINQINQQRTNQ